MRSKEHGAKLHLYLHLCKPFTNPDDNGDFPKCLPIDVTRHVLNSLLTTSLPRHVTIVDVAEQQPRLAVSHISGHPITRGRGGDIVVLRSVSGTLIRSSATPPSCAFTLYPPQHEYRADEIPHHASWRCSPRIAL